MFVSLDKSLVSIGGMEGRPRETLLSRAPLGQDQWVKVPEEGVEGVMVLGAPVGSRQFEAEALQARVDGVGEVLDALPSMDEPHCESYLLRSCFSFPKFGFSVWTVDTTPHREVLQDFDNRVLGALEVLVGTGLNGPQRTQSSLPASKTGMGLRSAEAHAPGAYLASLCSSQPLVKRMRHHEEQEEAGGPGEEGELNPPLDPRLEGAIGPSLEALNSQLEANNTPRLTQVGASTLK